MNSLASSLSPVRGARALARLFRDPDDLPQVFTVIESLSGGTIDRIAARLRSTEIGARLLRDRPDIVPLLSDRDALRRMPEGSLARAYLGFLESEYITADGIIAASAVAEARRELEPEAAYVHQRMRDTHDLWHAATGYKGDVLGEVALLGFTLAQTKNPAIGLIVGLGILRAGRNVEARNVILDGFQRGRRAAWLPAVEWEALLPRPVEEVRVLLGLGAPPVYQTIRSAELRAAN